LFSEGRQEKLNKSFSCYRGIRQDYKQALILAHCPRKMRLHLGAEAFPPCFLFPNWLNYTIEFAISKNYN